jgi:cobalt-zinc-cadmium efflux system membrane fusion protein
VNTNPNELTYTATQEPPKSSPPKRHRKLGLALAVAALTVLVALIAWRRSISGAAAEAKPAARDVPYLDGKWIRYSEDFAKRAGLVFAAVESSSLAPVVTVTGTVNFDAERMAAVGARIVGRVRAVHKLEGAEVKAGDVLAEIESAELGQAQAAVISARAHAHAATINEKREQELAEAHISSGREAELAAATAASARADLLAAEQRVRAFGGSAGAETGILELKSPIAGKVVERAVSRGQSVEPTHTAFRVADLSRVWVQLAVFERELSAVHAGDEVEITPQTDARKVLHGKVAYVGDVLDLETRTAPVRVVVDQPETPLRPGQSVTAKIRTAIAPASALVLPREAVTSVDGKSTVFVAHDANSVEPRTVQLGSQDGKRVEVLSGLEPNERVVTAGVFALKSEIYR